MACTRPLKGYLSRTVNPSGKRSVVFNTKDGFPDLRVELPCQKCTACRLERSRQMAIRIMHEAQMHDASSFLTLTFDSEKYWNVNSLDHREFQKFMKRMRKRLWKDFRIRVRFYMAGEYGDEYGRPHYHVCLFGFDFPDKYLWKMRNGFRVYRSALLEELWPFGFSEIGTVTFESAAYCARYIMKKTLGKGVEEIDPVTGLKPYERVCGVTGEIVEIRPEYNAMSQGIGKKWFEKYSGDVYPRDEVIFRGRQMKPPRYYNGLYEATEPDDMERIRRKRKREALKRKADSTPERLAVREKCVEARVKRLPRKCG